MPAAMDRSVLSLQAIQVAIQGLSAEERAEFRELGTYGLVGGRDASEAFSNNCSPDRGSDCTMLVLAVTL